MSLAALSTELDTNIVDFCDHESLHALSQTSKYWRTLSEPHLYNNLCFAIDQLMQMKQLLLTLLKRPDLVKHIKSFRIAPSIVPEEPVRDGFFDHFLPPQLEQEDGTGGEDVLKLLSIEEQEEQRHREQKVSDECQAFLPKMEKIIETVWPKLCPDFVSKYWLGRMNKDGENLDMLIALILTVVTKLEYLDIQVPKHSCVTLTRMLLHYHRTPEKVASGTLFPFSKLKEILFWGVTFPEDPGRFAIFWVPLPITAETYWLRDAHIDHFEYPVFQEHQHPPALQTTAPISDVFTIKEIHTGFTPMLRVMDLLRCHIYPFELQRTLRTGYFQNLEVLRLCKLGEAGQWCCNSGTDWPNFGHFLNECLPKLQEFQISIWWDEPDMWRKPGDLGEPAGALNALPNLEFVAMDLGLLVHSFSENAITELLELPATVLPENLKSFEITNVNLNFLNCVANLYTAPERREVFGQLMASLPSCGPFVIETYEKPSDKTVKIFELIGADLQEMQVDFELWWRDNEGKQDHRLV
jgi:hypothetical protein